MTIDIDIDLGAPGDPLGPVKEAFERRGVPISDAILTRLRSGATGRTRTAYRLRCVDRLRADDAALKTECCLRVLAAGREHRQRSHEPPRVYECFGLTRAMGAELGWTREELCKVIRVMRADIALWSTHTWDDGLVAQFREAAALYLRVHHHRNWKVFRSTNDIVKAAWDQHTIHGFYFALYHTAPPKTRGAWFPYELDLLWSFYARQHEMGDPLTPLDRQVLAGAVSLHPTTGALSRMVPAHVGVDYDAGCVTTHRHLLVTGSPKPVQVSGRERNGALLEKHAGREAEGGLATDGSVTKRGPTRPRRSRGPNRSVLSYLPRDVGLELLQQGFRTPGRKP